MSFIVCGLVVLLVIDISATVNNNILILFNGAGKYTDNNVCVPCSDVVACNIYRCVWEKPLRNRL